MRSRNNQAPEAALRAGVTAGGPATGIAPSTVGSFGGTAATTQQQNLGQRSGPAGFPAGGPATGITPSTVVSFRRSAATAQQQNLRPAGFPGGMFPSTVGSFGGTAATTQQQNLNPAGIPAGMFPSTVGSFGGTAATAQQQNLRPAGFPGGMFPSTVGSFGGTAATTQQQNLNPAGIPAGMFPSTVGSFGGTAATTQQQNMSPAGFPAGMSPSTVVSFGGTAANAQLQNWSADSGPARVTAGGPTGGFATRIARSAVVPAVLGRPFTNSQQQPSGSVGGLAENVARAAVIEDAPKRVARSNPKKRQIQAPLGCTVPGAFADPHFAMPPYVLPTAALIPLSPSMVAGKRGLHEALSLVPECWKEPPRVGERFINIQAAMDRIQGYGLWCGFAADCVNPQGVESSRFQCAHADFTVQLPESLNFCRNTRAMGCTFAITIVKIKHSGGEYEICEFLLLYVSSCA
jgi:hypothetical protein